MSLRRWLLGFDPEEVKALKAEVENLRARVEQVEKLRVNPAEVVQTFNSLRVLLELGLFLANSLRESWLSILLESYWNAFLPTGRAANIAFQFS